jgi:hypothetical protein
MKVLIPDRPSAATVAAFETLAKLQQPARIAGGALQNAIASGQIKTRIPIAGKRPGCFQ